MLSVHVLIDFIAVLLAFIVSNFFRQQFKIQKPAVVPQESIYTYYLFLIFGLIAGSVTFGSLNLYISGNPAFSKSFIGGLVGAIAVAEFYKRVNGIRGSTGFYFVPGLCLLLIIGRIGCFTAGLSDHTHGIPCDFWWAVDLGDGVRRHPVQLYESIAIAIFLSIMLVTIRKHTAMFMSYGFYLFTGYYAVQRFFWEFLKPYSTLGFGLNIFQYLCLGLLAYSIYQILHSRQLQREKYGE